MEQFYSMEKHKASIKRHVIMLYNKNKWVHIDENDNVMAFNKFLLMCAVQDIEDHALIRYVKEGFKSNSVELQVNLN